MVILASIYLFFLALVFALVEIEIEGKFGWAEKLPTWYRKSGLAKIYTFFNSKKPLTGYHLFMLLFLLLIIHFGFFVGLPWSLSKELEIITYYILFLTIEDFLWFVFNPNYGLKNFKKNKIWWHYDCKWVLGLFPLNYLSAVLIAILLTYFSSIIQDNTQFFYYYLISLGILTLLVLLSVIVLLPIYKKWYFFMRKKDERKKSNIFH